LFVVDFSILEGGSRGFVEEDQDNSLIGVGFGVVSRPEPGFNGVMKRLTIAALSISALFFLTQCASDEDDPFPVHSSASENAQAPVAGAAAPRERSDAGWSW
jgi:hypothetical protein